MLGMTLVCVKERQWLHVPVAAELQPQEHAELHAVCRSWFKANFDGAAQF